MHGYWVLHEACVQLRGEGGDRQVPGDPEVAVVSAGGGPTARLPAAHPGLTWPTDTPAQQPDRPRRGPMAELDDEVRAWVESQVGATLTSVTQVPAGGRVGYAIDATTDDGRTVALFLQRGGRGGLASFSGFAREAEVYRALEPLGIPIPHVWGVDEGRDVFLVDRAPGRTWMQPPRDPDEAESVAKDFMGHLARWHAAGAQALELPSFGPVRTVREHQLDQLAGIEGLAAVEEARGPLDALATSALEHLRRSLPDVDVEPVLVQGDTGPGNLMYEDGRVTAIIDWELAHLGDPMDDLAWLSWRATQHSWPDFPARLREYEAASGIRVDQDRIRYYRLNACLRLGPRFGLPDMGDRSVGLDGGLVAGGDAATDRAADGSAMIMAMLHRRMRLVAQADAMGIELPDRGVDAEDDGAELPPHARLYDNVLVQLQGIVERVDDRAASALAKAAARQVKYLKEIDRNGGRFDEQERDDLRALLKTASISRDADRQALAEAARTGKVPIEDYLHYHWRRLVREDHLMRVASGALYERGWPALT
jgi:aminoglycoside phosphotransferase (APT) family kinase protein